MKNRRYAVSGIILSVVMAFSGCKSLFPLDENPYKQTETTVSVSETTPTYVTESFIPIETTEETPSETTEITTTPEETTTVSETEETTTTEEEREYVEYSFRSEKHHDIVLKYIKILSLELAGALV